MCELFYDVLADHQRWFESGEKLGKRADLQGADLQGADLQGADLQWANLRGADLRGADLRDANLRDANLRDANLRDADLQGADLRGADLQGADLQGADLDFSCLSLSCDGTGIKGDRRLFAQILYHLTRQDWSEAGEAVQEQVEALNGLESINWFCEYREDLKRIGD